MKGWQSQALYGAIPAAPAWDILHNMAHIKGFVLHRLTAAANLNFTLSSLPLPERSFLNKQ